MRSTKFFSAIIIISLLISYKMSDNQRMHCIVVVNNKKYFNLNRTK